MKLFISYAHKDIKTVKRLVKLLENAEHEVWWDTALKAGQSWQQQLGDEIADCDVFVYVMTANSAWEVSEWCHWEFVTAVENDKPILPILVEKVDLPVVIGRLQYADLTDGLRADAIQKMLSDLDALHIQNTADLEPKPNNPKGDPARVEINATITASDNAQVNVIGQQDIDSQTNIEHQHVNKPQSTWNSAVVIGTIVAIISMVLGGLALFPNQVQDFMENLQPTPFEGIPFAEDEIGIVLADFSDLDAGAREVEQRIERQFEDANIPFIRVNHTIIDREQAQIVADTYNATITIWGESADAWIEVFYEITPRQDRRVVKTVDEVAVASDLENFSTYILDGMDTLYIINFTMGQLYYFDQDYETALTFFNQAVDKIPEGREDEVEAGSLYFYRAYSYSQLDDYEASIENYSLAIQLNPNGYVAYNNRGNAKSNLGDYEGAIQDYDKAIELDPNYAVAYRSKGRVRSKLGDYTGAIQVYNKAIELDPDDVYAYNIRGNAKKTLGDLGGAITDYDTAIILDPDYTYSYNNRGNAKKTLGDLDGAITDYDTTITLDPDDVYAYTIRGNAKKTLGDLDGAITDYDTAITLDSDYDYAYYNRANAYYDLSQYGKALVDYQKYIELVSAENTSDWVLERIAELEAQLSVGD